MSNDTIIKSKKWSSYNTIQVFNEGMRLYRESLIDPTDQIHKDILDRAQEILPEFKRKDSHYLAGRPRLSKRIFLKALFKERKNEKESTKKISDSISGFVSDPTIRVTIEEFINQRVNKELDSIFTPEFKARIEDSIFNSLDRFEKTLLSSAEKAREITGLVTGTFNGTFEAKPLLQPNESIPPVVKIVEPPVTEQGWEEVIPVEYDDTQLPPVTRRKDSTWLHVAVAGVMKKDHQYILKKADDARREIEIHYFVSDPDKIKIQVIPPGMNHIFIVMREGLGHTERNKLLTNYNHGAWTIIHKGSNSMINNAILDWSEKTRRMQNV